MSDVTQEDRDAAAPWLEYLILDISVQDLAQSFARHRIASTTALQAELAEARVRLTRLYSIILENDADTPIADNGMTVWDGLQEEARTTLANAHAVRGGVE